MAKNHPRCKFCWHGNNSPALSRGLSMSSINEHSVSSPKLVRSSTKLSCFASSAQSLGNDSNPFIDHPLIATNNNYILSPEVTALNDQYDVISFCHLLQRPLLRDFVVFGNSVKAKTGRRQTFSGEVRQRLSTMVAERTSCQRTVSKDSGLGSMNFDSVITQNDIENPDLTGWLYDVVTKQKRWCVLADMLFCIFANRDDNIPLKVVLVSGSRIIRVRFSSAKRDALDPLRSLDVKVIQTTPDLTISGQLKYQFVIEDCFTKTECSFAAESETLLDRWILMLKLASNLDTDVFCDTSHVIETHQQTITEPTEDANTEHTITKSSHNVTKPSSDNNVTKSGCDHSIAKSASSESHRLSRSSSVHSVGYIPTTDRNEHRLSRHNSISINTMSICDDNKDNFVNFGNTEGPTFSKVIQLGIELPEKKSIEDDPLDGTDEVDSIPKLVTKPPKFERQGSMEAFKGLVKKKTHIRAFSSHIQAPDSITRQQRSFNDLKLTNHGPFDNDMLSMSLPTSLNNLSCTNAYSTSMDYSSSPAPGLAQRIALKASHIRGKFLSGRRRGGDDTSVYDEHTKDSRIHGELYYKQMLKWGRVWCVVSRGMFMAFRKREDRSPILQLPLTDCSVNHVDLEKFSRDNVFKLCQVNARGGYFQAEEGNFHSWLVILKEETSTYESFQRLSPMFSELSDGDNVHHKQTDLNGVCNGNVTYNHDNPNTTYNHNNPNTTYNNHNNPNITFNNCDNTNKTFDLVDYKTPSDQHTQVPETGFSCWTLDNYFRRHHLNRENLTDSCDSLDSWDSKSTLTESDALEHSLASMEDIDSVSKNATFHIVPRRIEELPGEEDADIFCRDRTIYDRHLPGPNNEGLLLVGDGVGIEGMPVSASTPQAELQHVRRASLSDNNLASPHHTTERPYRFRRSFSLTKSLKKRKKTDVRQQHPVSISARNLDEPQTQGYLDICYAGDSAWKSVWCVLKMAVLYIYGSPIEEEAMDSINLERCSFRKCAQSYRDKQYAVEIKHLRHNAEYVAMDTEEDMVAWLSHLQAAVQEVIAMETEQNQQNHASLQNTEARSNGSVGESVSLNGQSVCVDESLQRELIQQKKQQLLHEVLLSKQQLQKQISISSKDFDNDSLTRSPSVGSPVSPRSLEVSIETASSSGQPSSTSAAPATDSENWKDLCRLKQRKMSTELKMESLYRALTSNQPKQKKKSRVRLPLDILRTKSPDVSSDVHTGTTQEVAHWESQLALLEKERSVILGEIEERQSTHSWYNGRADVTSQRTLSVMSDDGQLRDTTDDYRRLVKSDGGKFDVDMPPLTLESRLSGGSGTRVYSPILAMRSGGDAGGSKPTRLQKISKKFPNLPSLMPRKSAMRKVVSEDSGQVTAQHHRRSSLDNGKPRAKRNQHNRSSLHEYTAVAEQKHHNGSPQLHHDVLIEEAGNTVMDEESGQPLPHPEPIQPDHEPGHPLPNTVSNHLLASSEPDLAHVVPPNSRRSSGGTPPPVTINQQRMSSPELSLSPGSDSILSSVLLALDKFTDDQNGESQTYDVCSSEHSDPTSAEHDETIPPPDMFSEGSSVGSPECLTPTSSEHNTTQLTSEANTSVLTEHSGDTDSGRGSPMQDLAQFKSSRTNPSPDGTTKPTIKPKTLADISEFEDLIKDKLGAWPI